MIFAAKGRGCGRGAGRRRWPSVARRRPRLPGRPGRRADRWILCRRRAERGPLHAQHQRERRRVLAADRSRHVTAGSPTVPWIAWAESNGTRTAIFVARLVGTGADAHFEFADRGHQLGFGSLPDIAFSGHTPYVSWVGEDRLVHTGHFTDPATFVADHVSASQTFQRPPLTSLCTADPFTADGSACPGASLGTPFVQFDDAVATGDPAVALRGASYPAGEVETGTRPR